MATEADLICSIRCLEKERDQLRGQNRRIEEKIKHLQTAIRYVRQAEEKHDAVLHGVSGIKLSADWKGTRFDDFERARSLGGTFYAAAKDYTNAISSLRQEMERRENALLIESDSIKGQISRKARQMKDKQDSLEHFKE